VTETADWNTRGAAVWNAVDDFSDEDLRRRIVELVTELPAGNAAGLYELASAWDSTGHSDVAVPIYRQALAAGLKPDRRRQAVIQLASSLRNLGEATEAVELLTAELDRESDELDDGIRAFLALALVDAGREREAASIALTALAGHMTRYQRSVRNYARLLIEEDKENE
jgi:tetratricopeptide (TPR) repeat protein